MAARNYRHKRLLSSFSMAKITTGDLLKADTDLDVLGLYPLNLRHVAGQAVEQLDNGLYMVHRLTKFCNRTADAHAAQSKLFDEMVLKEGKKRAVISNQMANNVDIFNFLQDTTAELNEFEKKFTTALHSCAEDLSRRHMQGEQESKTLKKQYQGIASKLSSLQASVDKDHKACISSWNSLRKLYSAVESSEKTKEASPKDLKKYNKAKAAMEKQRAKAEKLFTQMESKMTDWNTEKRRLQFDMTDDMLRQVETAEVARINTVRHVYRSYVQELRKLAYPLDGMIERLEKKVNAIAPDNMFSGFVQQIIMDHGTPPPFEPFRLQLPCEAKTLETASGIRELMQLDTKTAVAQREATLGDSPASSFDAKEHTRMLRPPGYKEEEEEKEKKETPAPAPIQEAIAEEQEEDVEEKDADAAVADAETVAQPPSEPEPPAEPPVDPQPPSEPEPPSEGKQDGPPALPPRPSRNMADERKVRVLYAWDSGQEEDLPLEVGDIIDVLSSEEGWCLGENTVTGLVGMFPGNHAEDYVEEAVQE